MRSIKKNRPSYVDFDHKAFQQGLEKYSLVGEVGVLSYKYSKKIIPQWRFRTPEIAEESAKRIYNIFIDEISRSLPGYYSIRMIKHFIKADICRKFLQMGYTRSMRYARHKGGINGLKHVEYGVNYH